MTIEEKMEMYRNKKAFINDISKAFENKPSKTSVTSVEYEVYRKDITEDRIYFAEYIIVNFFGGGKCVRNVNGNSNSANFRAVGELIDGGYYDEVRDYETIVDNGFALVKLEGESKLDQLLAKPMTHISDVRACFNYCKNSQDVEKVIDMIPVVFGSFEVDYKDSDEDDTFVIINEWWENDEPQTETTEYEFYVE